MERTAPSRGHRILRLTAVAGRGRRRSPAARDRQAAHLDLRAGDRGPRGQPGSRRRRRRPAPRPAPERRPRAAPCGSPAPAASGAGAVTSAIAIEAFDLGFKPNAITVAAAGSYDVTFKNTGSIPHDLTFADGTKLAANAGETVTGKVAVPAAGITFICSIPGHAEAGMKGCGQRLRARPPSGGDSHGGPAPTTDVAADPNAPEYTLYDATAPAVLPGTTHDIDLVVEEKKMTVAPGFVVGVWTFNGTVPGPVIRVHLGDTIRVHLKNPATNKLPHSVDFHASQVAWNDEMTSINPGEEKLYEWKADYAGVWMYHCGTAPALHHIANGMYGMVIVEPKGGFKQVDKEFALVQSEWYLGPQGEPASLTKASAGAPAPDFVVFNGVANQYKDNPLLVDTGKSVRIFILDAGPNIDSSFHIVGTIFNTVIKEGIELSPLEPRPLRLAGRRPVARPGRDRGADDRRGRALPDRDPRLQLRRSRRPGPPPGRRRRPEELMRPELTKRADYAIRAMLTLSRSSGDGPMSARLIAADQAIPARFLPQVLGDLGRAGLVRAESGRNGGYRLARPPNGISLLDVIEAVEGDSRRRTCVLRGDPCGASGECAVHAVFAHAQDALRTTLAEASLAGLSGRPAVATTGSAVGVSASSPRRGPSAERSRDRAPVRG